MKASVSLSYISEFRFLTLTVVATLESDIHSLKPAFSVVDVKLLKVFKEVTCLHF